MYEKLVKALRTLSQMGTRYGMACLTMGEAADAIEELSKDNLLYETQLAKMSLDLTYAKEQLPRWIPVEERLPEKNKYVLVRYANNDMAVACVFDRDEHMTFWRAMTDEGWCADCDVEPTHWMPLPKPPEEDVHDT